MKPRGWRLMCETRLLRNACPPKRMRFEPGIAPDLDRALNLDLRWAFPMGSRAGAGARMGTQRL